VEAGRVVKQGLTNVDVAALAMELQDLLVGGRIEKAYQPAKDQVLLRLRKKGLGRMDLLFHLGKFLTITRKPPENPDKPSMVAQILRKDYGNARIIGVRQVGFDRILRFDLEKGDGKKGIVFEIFGDGNMILLDAEDTITLPMRGGDYGSRSLRKGATYQPPPGGADPFSLSRDDFISRGQAGVKDAIRFLAVDLGFGPQWATELCAQADVPKNTPVAEATPEQWQALHEVVDALHQQLQAKDLAPCIVYKGEEAIDAVPFPMTTLSPTVEEAATFVRALDGFFLGVEEDDEGQTVDPRQSKLDAAVGKVQRQVDQMERSMGKFVKDEDAARAKGDALYANFQTVEGILSHITAARAQHDWAKINEILAKGRAEGNAVAQTILSLDGSNATAQLALQDLAGTTVKVTVDVRLTIQENAEIQYTAAKKAKSRQDGATSALVEAKKRLKAAKDKGLDGYGAAPKANDGPQRHFWFEPYRWTVTPSGFLCVGGRNASQNDQVVKKYLREGDRYVHAQIHGAPSIVVRSADGANRVPEEEDLLIAGQFASCASRGWRQFGQGSAYWVTPQQVNKTPRSGEFVPKGAWIIHGKRNIMDKLPMEWGVAVLTFNNAGMPTPDGLVKKIVGGPIQGLSAFTDRVWKLVPGDIDANEAARIIAEGFDVTMEEAHHVLPSGPVNFEAQP
jgi:predicted ribosome quality control (RQC) complex YloA/Tae2 family protein